MSTTAKIDFEPGLFDEGQPEGQRQALTQFHL